MSKVLSRKDSNITISSHAHKATKRSTRYGKSFIDNRHLNESKLADFDSKFEIKSKVDSTKIAIANFQPEISKLQTNQNQNFDKIGEKEFEDSFASEKVIDSSVIPVPQKTYQNLDNAKLSTYKGPEKIDTLDCYLKTITKNVKLCFNEEELKEENVCKSPSPEWRPLHPTKSKFLAWSNNIAKVAVKDRVKNWTKSTSFKTLEVRQDK